MGKSPVRPADDATQRALPGAGRHARARAAARRSLARRADRLLSARHQGEPAPRVPPRAHAAGSPELVPRSDADWAAAALGLGGAHHALLALQPAPLHAVGAVRAVEAGAPGAARQQHPDANRRAADPRRAPQRSAARRVRRELGSHRRQGRDLAGDEALSRPERGHALRSGAVSRDRYRARGRHRLAADRPLPPPPTARGVRGACRRLRPRSGCPLVLVMGNTPTNAPYEGGSVARLVAWWEQGAREIPASTATTPPRPSLARALGWVRPARRLRAATLYRPGDAGHAPPAR